MRNGVTPFRPALTLAVAGWPPCVPNALQPLFHPLARPPERRSLSEAQFQRRQANQRATPMLLTVAPVSQHLHQPQLLQVACCCRGRSCGRPAGAGGGAAGGGGGRAAAHKHRQRRCEPRGDGADGRVHGRGGGGEGNALGSETRTGLCVLCQDQRMPTNDSITYHPTQMAFTIAFGKRHCWADALCQDPQPGWSHKRHMHACMPQGCFPSVHAAPVRGKLASVAGGRARERVCV